MHFNIIIITKNRAKQLAQCLESLLKQIKPAGHIIVGVNGRDPQTTNFLKKFKNNNKLTVKQLPQLPLGEARNALIDTAPLCDYYFFIDDDAFLPQGYFKKVEQVLQQYPFKILGGPDQTPPKSNSFSKAIGAVLSSPLIMGPTYKRHSVKGEANLDATERDLILCNLWIHASLFKKENIIFEKNIQRNEENFFLIKAKKAGVKSLWHPDIFVYHHRKKDLVHLCQSVYQSAFYRSMMSLQKKTQDPLYLLPLLFSVALAGLYPLLIMPLSFLAIANTIFLSLNFKLGLKSALATLVIQPAILVSYAFGLFSGLLYFGVIIRIKPTQKITGSKYHG